MSVDSDRVTVPTALRLAELRRSRGVSQVELAAQLGPPWTQASVSRFERQTDARLSTLAAYLAGLGASMVVGAAFPDDGGYQRVRLTDTDDS